MDPCTKCGQPIERPSSVPGLCEPCAGALNGQFGRIFDQVIQGKDSRNPSVQVRIQLSAQELANGTIVPVDLSRQGGSKDVQVTVPANTPAGTILRLKDLSTRQGATDVYVHLQVETRVRLRGVLVGLIGLALLALGAWSKLAAGLAAGGAGLVVMGAWVACSGRWPLRNPSRIRWFDALVLIAAALAAIWVYAWMQVSG